MNADLQHLYAHHAVGLCPEERCVAARANLAALMERLQAFAEQVAVSPNDTAGTRAAARYALTGSLAGVVDEMRTVASREGSGT